MEKPVSATHPRQSLVIPLGLMVLGGLALFVDLAISRRCVAGEFRGLHRFLEQIEPFGQPPGAIIISLALWTCGALSGRDSLRVVIAPIGAGLSADVLKLLVARARPYHFFQNWGEAAAATVFETFGGWLPMFSGGSRMQGCPSAHTAFVTGFCVALSRMFPQGRLLFAVVAALVALQRIEGGAHFLSDTLWGGAVGSLIGTLWMDASSRWMSAASRDEFDPNPGSAKPPAQTA
ncbi:MAG: phosphatase PAP2 family protein [Planctomycetaceae bacterium]|jgi:membrane-associated phospholipid phosphatase